MLLIERRGKDRIQQFGLGPRPSCSVKLRSKSKAFLRLKFVSVSRSDVNVTLFV